MIQAYIAGKERTLLVDTISNIYLVQPGVQPSTVRAANLVQIEVTGDSYREHKTD
jgi:hypothetical protein